MDRKVRLKIEAGRLLARVRRVHPVIHHLTNWVTIYDCANVVKMLGASPVMAHAREEVQEMTAIASALVLNIGTLTVDFVASMQLAARRANRKKIPVILDVCGAGATDLRDRMCFQLLDHVKIDIVKGNASEIARVCGLDVKTRGVDASTVRGDCVASARRLALERKCTVVVTGQEDVVTDGQRTYLIRNGHPWMAHVVGTGCMAASVIGTFAAVEKDLALAAASGLVCYEVAAEVAVCEAQGPASFKEKMLDRLYHLNPKKAQQLQRVCMTGKTLDKRRK